jgi:hypothetical protein
MSRRLLAALLPACLFAVVLGMKWEVINRYGSDLPNWDQWDAEGLHVYVPWFEHRLGPADFFRPHNEHRVVLTKLLGLAELLANGQWDARLQCAVNALLSSGLAVLFFLLGRRHLARCWQPVLFGAIALLFGLPLAWQNVLGGFHSQQYFLAGLSFGAICLLPSAEAWSRRWWLGAACALLALISMGSGLFAAAIVIPVVLLRGWLLARRPGSAWPTLALCLVVLALGWLGRVEVGYHAVLKAHSVSDFVLYTIHSLQWPSPDHPWYALIGWMPSAILLVVVLRRRVAAAEMDFVLILLGLAGWVGLQILASAYARGAGAELPASRYIDTLVLGLVVNLLALLWLVSWKPSGLAGPVVVVVWLAVLGFGVERQCRNIYAQDLPSVRAAMAACEQNVRQYLRTGDVAELREPDIPYPSRSSFLERIDVPCLRAIMPVSVRPPLRLESSQPGPFRLLDSVPQARPPDAPADAPDVAGSPATGLPPGTPPLAYARTWGSHGATTGGQWDSITIHLPRRTYLRFLVTGPAGPGSGLGVRGSGMDDSPAPVPLPAYHDAAWHPTHAAVAGGNVSIEAHVDDPAHWFAFSEPVEMAPLSYWAWLAVRQGRRLWQTAAVLGVLLWGWEWRRRRRG